MSEVDWDKLPDAPGEEVDWDKLPDAPEGPAQDISFMNALDRGFTQLATGGLRDEAAGALENPVGALKKAANYAVEGIGNKLNDSDLLKSLGISEKFKQEYGFDPRDQDIKEYIAERNASRNLDEEAAKQQPLAYGIGQVGGGIASSFIPGLRATQAGLAPAIGSGVAQGALTGFGSSEGDSIDQLYSDTALGGTSGGAGGAIGYGIGKGIEKAKGLLEGVPDKLKEFAEWEGARAQGLQKSQANKLTDKQIRAVGRQGIDEKLFGIATSPEEISARNKNLMNRVMQERGDIYKAIDESGQLPFDPREYANMIEGEYGDILGSDLRTQEKGLLKKVLSSARNKGEPIMEERIIPSPPQPGLSDVDLYMGNPAPQQAAPEIYSEMVGRRNIPLSEAQNFVEKDLGSLAKWTGMKPSPREILAQDLQMAGRESLNKAAEEAANKLGMVDAGAKIRESNQIYSTAKNADMLLRNKLGMRANNKIGLRSTIGGASQAAGDASLLRKAGNVVTTVVGAETLQRYGNQALAHGVDRLADVVAKAPRMLGKYAAPLQNAAQRGGQSLAITNYVLQQSDPEYRKHINNLFDIPQDSDQ